MYEQEAVKGKPYLRQYVDPVWSGSMIYRALVPAEKLYEICGRKHPIIDNPIIVCIGFTSVMIMILMGSIRYFTQYCGKSKVRDA